MTKVLRNTDPYFGGSVETFDTNKAKDLARLHAQMAEQKRAGTAVPAALLGLYGGLLGGVLGNRSDNTAAGAGLGALAGAGLGAGLGYGLNTLEQNMFRDRYGIPDPDSPTPSRAKSASYIMGVYQAGIDAGALAPTSMEKMAQQADVAAAATQDELASIGGSITAQDISSLAKIMSVLTQLQHIYQTQGAPMDPSMMQGPPMDPSMMQGPPMDPSMMQGAPMDPSMMQGPPMQGPPMQGPPMQGPPMQGPPMGPPPQGMMAPGPGPAVQ
jgi:hypothetical protein